MITVWGRATSSNVQAAMWAIGELGLEHERHDWGGAHGGNDDPDFRTMNPNGLIPVLRNGDAVLWESPVIVRYLAAQYGDEQFWPSDPAARACQDMWAEWTKTSVAPELVYKVFWQMVRVADRERRQDVIDEGVAALGILMPRLDARLAQSIYIGGEDLGFGDIVTGSFLYRYYELDFPKAPTPNLDAYYGRLCARAAYREHVMVSFESLRAR